MKLIALIIAVYISLLTVQPVLLALTSMSNSESIDCCGKSEYNKEQSQKGNSKSEHYKQCNPFQLCSTCCGYIIVSEFNFENIIFKDFEQLITKYIENKNSDFFSSYFQPPEII